MNTVNLVSKKPIVVHRPWDTLAHPSHGIRKMHRRNTVFMFSGQGSQYYQMGRELFETHSVFRDCMQHLDGVVSQQLKRSVIDTVYSGNKSNEFSATSLTHPAIFMIEYSLAQCLREEGVEPDMTLGASLGSFAAAAVAGQISLDNAISLVLDQAEAFNLCCDSGGIIAVISDIRLSEHPLIQESGELAAIHFTSHFALAAPKGNLDVIEETLKGWGIVHQRLPVEFAFHSSWIDAANERIRSSGSRVTSKKGNIPVVLCDWAQTFYELPADFFWRVVRSPIRFDRTIANLEQTGPHDYIDVGPSGTLANFARYACSPGLGSRALPVLTPFGNDRQSFSTVIDTISER